MSFRQHSTPQKFLFYGFVTVLILRLAMVFTMGLMPQDAYYYFYSEHLSLSYFDHPPGVAVMLWLFTHVLGTAVWSVKLTNFLVTCGTLWVLYRLANQFLSEQRSRTVVYVLGTTLLLTDVSIVATPDVPLLLFWSLSMLAMYKALQQPGIVHWLIAGGLAGIAFDCKYTALYLPVGLIGYLILSTEHRRLLLSWRVPAFLLAFVLAASPVILWNIQNAFASFEFQSGDRVATILEFRLRPMYFLGFLGHQTALLLPIFAVATIAVFWKHIKKVFWRRKLPDSDTLFLLSFSLPFILAFLGISTVYWVKINWLIPAYIAASILVVRYMRMRWLKWQMWAALVANALLLIQIAFYPINIHSDDTYWGWEKLSDAVTQLQEKYPGYFVFSKDGYKTTAILNFYHEEKIYVGNILGEHALEYSIVDDDLSYLRGQNALFIDSQGITKDILSEYVPPDSLPVYFEDIALLPPIILYNASGKPLRQFAIVECKNYRGAQSHAEQGPD